MSRAQNTMRNCGAPSPATGTSSQRHGSSSSETGQYPASVRAAPDSAADPNSNTVASAACRCRRTSTAPWVPEAATSVPATPETAEACWSGGPPPRRPPLHHEKRPIGRERRGKLDWVRVLRVADGLRARSGGGRRVSFMGHPVKTFMIWANLCTVRPILASL